MGINILTNEPQVLSVADRVAKQKAEADAAAADSKQTFEKSRDNYTQNQQDYIDGKRNPLSDILKKPVRDTQTEDRQKAVAIGGLIGDAIGLIGKGYAASKGVRPTITEGATTYKAINELKKLDDTYKEQGYRYDHQTMLDTLRRRQAADDLQRAELDTAARQYERDQARVDAASHSELGLAVQQEAKANALDALKDERAYNEKQEARQFGRQIYLRGASGGDDQFNISAGNVALVVKNPKTGKMEPISDGDFQIILNKVKKSNPEIAKQLSFATDNEQRKSMERSVVMEYWQNNGGVTDGNYSTLTPTQAQVGDTAQSPIDAGALSAMDRVLVPIMSDTNITEQQKSAKMQAALSAVDPLTAKYWLENYGRTNK